MNGTSGKNPAQQRLLDNVGGTPMRLQDAVLADGTLHRGEGRTLVFAGEVAAANEVAAALTEAGLQPLLYHKGVSPEDRANALSTMRSRQAS